jgi:uncharacterized protein (DUF305 family)
MFLHRFRPALATLALVALFSLSACLAPGSRAPMQGMRGMHDSASEYEFLVEMIPHHQEAVDSSLLAGARTQKPELKLFVDTIASDQTREIALMNEWLKNWYPGKVSEPAYSPMMRPVEGLSADKADRSYLEDMIMHHRMAVMMADGLLKARFPVHPELADFARGIIRAQNAEIERMEAWLKDWYGVSASSPGMH